MEYLRVWLGVSFALAEFTPLPSVRTGGACVFQGSLFLDDTVWKPDSCQDCRCHGDIVVCKPVVCKNPQCDFEKGEVLQIAANQCCPECVLRTTGLCHHEGKTHGHGTEWTTSQCTICSCSHGEVRCTRRSCPSLSCGPEELESIPENACCPKCTGPGKHCSFDGRLLLDGEEWQLSQCSKCVCRNGTTQCFTAQCQPLLCGQDEEAARLPGKCCPQCLPRSCSSAGKVYQDGEQWTENACTTCICDKGETRCHEQVCPSLTCEKGQNKVHHPRECCDKCMSSTGNCLYNGILRYHDEMWKGSTCEFCTCDQGQVTCNIGECASVKCTQDEELIHLDGKCCPECVSRHQHCLYEEQIKDEGERWNDGPCKMCECRDAQVICYQASCSPCPVGTLAVKVLGQCCPVCKSVPCDQDCLTCSQSPDHCDLCRDPRKHLQSGRCVHSCDLGFYQSAGLCLACRQECATCTNGFECTSCQPSLLMKERQCVNACGEGFYQDHYYCLGCHKSCATCWGPTEKNCLSCQDQLQVLKEGSCEDSCGQGFYNKNGVCDACDSSCESCGPESPRCLTCAKNTVWHEGECFPECPPGHYPDGTGRCSGCHVSCASCKGPSAAHCTSCSHSWVLHQNQCLPVCGQSFYPDHGICKACHPSCLNCVGPEPSNCTQCRKPEEGVQADKTFEEILSGTCVSRCKDHFYLENTGFCEACHDSCLACQGKSPDNCTSCKSSQVLFDGRCFPHCPHGSFNQKGNCSMCHPSCRQCRGPTDSDCIACHPHALLVSGTCRTSCKEEQYLNLVGYCVDCHPLCQQCVADLHNTGSICLRCQNARYLLLGDHCVSSCPTGYYPENGACKRCHSSCKTCHSYGPSSCLSCEADLVLSHNGLCTSTCFPGHYLDENNTCQPCNAQCWSCDSPSRCTSCRDSSKVLLFGECQYESCAQQYYLDLSTKTCKECDWSCNSCQGPLSTDCLQCMDGYVLQNSICVEQCSLSFYRDADHCKSCGDHCLECLGPHECTHCEEPFLLLEAQCTQKCGKRHYVDTRTQRCIACPPGCLECSHEEQCHLCDHGMSLKNGLCVSSCAPGFFGHLQNGTCHGSTYTHLLKMNASLVLGIGSVKPLDFSLLDVHAIEDRGTELLFHVASIPTNGQLVLLVNGKEVPLGATDHFNWEDLTEKRVRFVHSKDKPRKGHFSLRVSDQQFFSEPQLINVQAFSTQAPYLLKNEALRISTGQSAPITTQLLDIRDDDNPQDVVVEVVNAPSYGRLLQPLRDPGALVHRFQLDDLARGLLYYTHDGSARTSDAILLQASDGYSFQNILFKVQIVPKIEGDLQLVANSLVWVPEGGMLPITNRILRAEVLGARDSEIIYTIAEDHPRFGELVLLMNMPAGSPMDGRQHLPDGRMATPTNTFTQQDINEGVVWYKHSGSQTQSDSFSFQVSSTIAPQAHLENQVFNIAILPKTPEPPKLFLGANLHMTVSSV